jgi:hypothetical protein
MAMTVPRWTPSIALPPPPSVVLGARPAMGEPIPPRGLADPAHAALRNHPGFRQAMMLAATGATEFHPTRSALDRVINDRGRMVAGLMMLDMHYYAGGGRGFAAAWLRQAAVVHGFASPGRIDALLLLMRASGLLESVAGTDRREKRLAPTPLLFDAFRTRWDRRFAALVLIHPDSASARASLADPRYIGALAHGFVQAYIGGFRFTDHAPALLDASDREAGLLILLSLLVAGHRGVALLIAPIARRYGVSRAHVLKVLRAAERAGLAAPCARSGGYSPTPALADALENFFTVLFAMDAHCIASASAVARSQHEADENPPNLFHLPQRAVGL